MKRILIADDEVDALRFLEKGLKRKNYYVTAVATAEEVIKVAAGDKPDLFILDIAMPGMDGFTLAENLRKSRKLKDIPVIFITGKELLPKAIQDLCDKAGASDYIMKPCSLQDIVGKIEAVLG